MDFISIIMFLVVYYIRPQEWSGALSAFRPVAAVMAFSLLAMVFRKDGFSVRSLVKTPHDWFMFAYFGWVLFNSSPFLETWAWMKVFLVSYIVIVHALSDWDRMKRFIGWWMAMIFIIAGLAVVSQMGWDPLDSYYVTNSVQKGRLSLNLSIFENPNALGHNVIPLVPMLYFVFVWRRPIFSKEMGAMLMIMPLYCLFLTQSKGSYLSGFATLLTGFVFGRPKIAQIAILAFALTVGWAGLNMLPRMEQMKSPRADEAIYGRLLAWKVGLNTLNNDFPYGIGYGNFQDAFARVYGYPKAAHSTYIQIGAEQGYGGLFLFVGIIVCCFRTLLMARTQNDDQERIRRILIVLLISYCVSSWMINWGYHAAFFIIASTIAAFHRLTASPFIEAQEAMEEIMTPAAAPVRPLLEIPQPAPALLAASTSTIVAYTSQSIPSGSPSDTPATADTPSSEPPANEKPITIEEIAEYRVWSHPGILDILMVWGATASVIWFWKYILRNL